MAKVEIIHLQEKGKAIPPGNELPGFLALFFIEFPQHAFTFRVCFENLFCNIYVQRVKINGTEFVKLIVDARSVNGSGHPVFNIRKPSGNPRSLNGRVVHLPASSGFASASVLLSSSASVLSADSDSVSAFSSLPASAKSCFASSSFVSSALGMWS